MKKILIFAFMSLAVVACDMETHGQYSMTSISDFEFDATVFTDSVYLFSPFYGGSLSYSIVFDSVRESDYAVMTGGIGATMKRDSSLVIKSDNEYPQFTMFATSAAQSSTACAVFYQNDDPELMPDHDIIFINSADGTCTPASVVINNTQQTVYDLLSEDSPSKFEPGDWVKLTVTGSATNKNTGALEKTGSIDYYLADWRKGYADPDSVLTSWRTIPLGNLGQIEYIDFNIESSRTNLVKSFCFDNLAANIFIEY